MTRTNRECITFIFLFFLFFAGAIFFLRPPRKRTNSGGHPRAGSWVDRVTQGSVQIELIFRLLLKITVDWPFHANYECLQPARAQNPPKYRPFSIIKLFSSSELVGSFFRIIVLPTIRCARHAGPQAPEGTRSRGVGSTVLRRGQFRSN